MKIALVTGASSGMGKEFVRLILKEQLSFDEIWVVARRRERLERWPELYKEQKFRILPLDLTKEEDMKKLEEDLSRLQPGISLMIHCAGMGIMGKISEIPVEDQLEMVDVNGKSAVHLTSLLLPYMDEESRMIYLVSAAAFLPQPGFAVYAASKSFELFFVRALRAELKNRRISVTAVCPGAVRTEFFRRASAIRQLPAYKKLLMADPEKVVKKAYKDALAGKEISVYGVAMKLFYAAAGLLPHSLFLKFL